MPPRIGVARGGRSAQQGRKRVAKGICILCGTTSTPQWRNDPAKKNLPEDEKKEKLCNSCGLKASSKLASPRKPKGSHPRAGSSPATATARPARKRAPRGTVVWNDGAASSSTGQDEKEAIALEGLMMLSGPVPKKARPTIRLLPFRPSWLYRPKPKPVRLYPLPGIPSFHAFASSHASHASRPRRAKSSTSSSSSSSLSKDQRSKADASQKSLFVETTADTLTGEVQESPASATSSLMPITPTSESSSWASSTGGLLVEIGGDGEMNDYDTWHGKDGGVKV